jgi:alpha-beta hydrolase superfamily lysophospholipase
MNAPGPISPTKKIPIPATAGELYGEAFLPDGPRGIVLVTHGYAEHCGRYREVAHVITKAGWAALTYDVRGHGQSPGARGAIRRFDTYLDDLGAAHAVARQLIPAPAPLVLLGHSHGGLITLRALSGDRPPQAAAAILSSPYLALRLKVSPLRKLFARAASQIVPMHAQRVPLDLEAVTRDAAKQAERAADRLCFDIATARWFTESSAAQEYVAKHAARIQIPTTWLVAGDDPIADPDRTRKVAAQVRNAAYHDLIGFRHEVFNELDRGKAFQEVTHALAACVSGSTSVQSPASS